MPDKDRDLRREGGESAVDTRRGRGSRTGIFYHPSFSRRSYLTRGARLEDFPRAPGSPSSRPTLPPLPARACFRGIYSGGSFPGGPRGGQTGPALFDRLALGRGGGHGRRKDRIGRGEERFFLHRRRRASFGQRLLRRLLLFQ